jgi:hypothetical protein
MGPVHSGEISAFYRGFAHIWVSAFGELVDAGHVRSSSCRPLDDVSINLRMKTIQAKLVAVINVAVSLIVPSVALLEEQSHTRSRRYDVRVNTRFPQLP